jgi:hypothetical protein
MHPFHTLLKTLTLKVALVFVLAQVEQLKKLRQEAEKAFAADDAMAAFNNR